MHFTFYQEIIGALIGAALTGLFSYAGARRKSADQIHDLQKQLQNAQQEITRLMITLQSPGLSFEQREKIPHTSATRIESLRHLLPEAHRNKISFSTVLLILLSIFIGIVTWFTFKYAFVQDHLVIALLSFVAIATSFSHWDLERHSGFVSVPSYAAFLEHICGRQLNMTPNRELARFLKELLGEHTPKSLMITLTRDQECTLIHDQKIISSGAWAWDVKTSAVQIRFDTKPRHSITKITLKENNQSGKLFIKSEAKPYVLTFSFKASETT